MIESLVIKYANALEKRATEIKKFVQNRKKKQFVDKYDFIEVKGSPKTDTRFNSYEGTSLELCETLANSGILSKNDKIVDIGCGTGIFIIYMASRGFTNLVGIEYNKELFRICNRNIDSYKKHDGVLQKLEIINGNALEIEYDEDITCFYLFNTFYDKDTYTEWLNKVETSIMKKPRNIKIVILFPTVASMGAMRERTWLEEKGRVISKAQRCYNCVHFIIYEGGETFENLANFNNK